MTIFGNARSGEAEMKGGSDFLFAPEGRWACCGVAPFGPPVGRNYILKSYSNGGGLRALLDKTDRSQIGQNTDIFDWLPRFRDPMDEILLCDVQDRAYIGGRRNQMIMCKPCFPNNTFRAEGVAPGNSDGPELIGPIPKPGRSAGGFVRVADPQFSFAVA